MSTAEGGKHHHDTVVDAAGHHASEWTSMGADTRKYLAKPVLMILTEFVGTIALSALAAAGLGVVSSLGTPYTAIGAALSYALVIAFLTVMFVVWSGAMFNPGHTMLRAMMWVTRLTRRDYIKKKHFKYVKEHSWLPLLDFIMWVLITGAQVGASFLGMLIIRPFVHKSAFVDLTKLLTRPEDNMEHHAMDAFGLAILLNIVVMLVYGICSAQKPHTDKTHSTEHTHAVLKKGIRQVGAGIALFTVSFICIGVSYGFGAGTILNFALDAAYAVGITGDKGKWWIWVVAQIIASVAVTVVIAVFQWVIHFAKPEKDPHAHHHDHTPLKTHDHDDQF